MTVSTEVLIVKYVNAPTPPLAPLSHGSSPLPLIPSLPLPLPSPPLFEVGESSAAAAARQTGLEFSYGTDYGFINTLDASIRDTEERAPTTLKEVDERVTDLATTLMQETKEMYVRHKDAQEVVTQHLEAQVRDTADPATTGWSSRVGGQLEILGETISQEDMNLKFLGSLPSEWKTHTLIWRNKPDLDTLSMDDLYNNMKIYETEVKGSSSSNQNSQNVAFMSSNNSGSSNQAHGSNSANTDNNEDLQHINADDLEEMDIKWQMAMLTMKARRFRNKTGRKISANGSETIRFNKSKGPLCKGVQGSKGEQEQITCSSSSSSSDSEVSTCSKACLKSYETLKEHYDNLTKDFNKSQLNVGAYKAGLESIEARLDVYKKNEERDDLKLTLEKFENSSKNLSKLLEIQVSDKFKTGVGYDSQVVDSQVFNIQVNDKYKIGKGYHEVPPPYTGNFMPLKPNLVLADEEEYCWEF
ncbi:hypothetical protein Tco_1055564 [Tanacetum coccineum]|uniref:Uncharacterized protein n=1 Tax=Tanacetum coccineum TaxID=301880 RepID=A0ABQ5H1U2_9ASTR